MVTESPATVVPPEVAQNIETLHGTVEKLQQELAQALEIWQSALAEEKKKFDELLQHKELAWQEQESQWARQSQAYEERLAETTSEFESRLKQAEQNATRALSELDDAWQRDKLEWGPAAQAEWPAQRRALEEKIRTLEEEKTKEPAHPTSETVQALQAQLTEFQHTVASLQNQAAHSDELVNACVQALDYQISVLYDIVQSKLVS